MCEDFMRLYSTRNPDKFVGLPYAVLKGLPDDNGLFMPAVIPPLPPTFFQNIDQYSFQDIAFEVSKHLMKGAIPDSDLRQIIEESITFDAPLTRLDDQRYVLELFHGPTLAFKDFGARFMARLMSYFIREEKEKLYILVATSGDTGGAVASGFLQTPGIEVIILYPSGKVSALQEKQLTTLGHNITALEIEGTFDDCQAIVKQAFLDTSLTRKLRLTSANSINIARLIPQSFYYYRAWQQLPEREQPFVFSVPSGNFGNMTAGLFAQRMGLPVTQFLAATNANDVIPQYLINGQYTPRPSTPTISNAMDVGNPSNFDRMLDLFQLRLGAARKCIDGYAFTDSQTRSAIGEIYSRFGYEMDPHGAVGYLALQEFLNQYPNMRGIILETAHPSKFPEVVAEEIGKSVAIPDRLSELADREKVSVRLSKSYEDTRDFLMKLS